MDETMPNWLAARIRDELVSWASRNGKAVTIEKTTASLSAPRWRWLEVKTYSGHPNKTIPLKTWRYRVHDLRKAESMFLELMRKL